MQPGYGKDHKNAPHTPGTPALFPILAWALSYFLSKLLHNLCIVSSPLATIAQLCQKNKISGKRILAFLTKTVYRYTRIKGNGPLVMKLIVAIDGPAGAGKGTVGPYLAGVFGLAYLDTGLLYRSLAYKVIQENVDPEDEVSVTALAKTISIQNSDQSLRGEVIGNLASRVSVMPNVRDVLTHLQRNFCETVPDPYRGAVLDGRDIGTVVWPQTPCKLFITARPDVRLQRRLSESQGMDQQQLMQTLTERDKRDQERPISPSIPAPDAFVIDTSDFSVEESCAQAVNYVKAFFP